MSQVDNLEMATFVPVDDERQAQSDQILASTEWASLEASNVARAYRGMTHPVRILHRTAMQLALNVNLTLGRARTPLSEIFDNVSEFHLATLDAAIAETPIDLIAIFDRDFLPRVEEWSRDPEFTDSLVSDDDGSGQEMLSFARRLLHDRLITASQVDFIALKEAFFIMQTVNVFDGNPHSDAEAEVTPVLLDVFPTLRRMERALICRAGKMGG